MDETGAVILILLALPAVPLSLAACMRAQAVPFWPALMVLAGGWVAAWMMIAGDPQELARVAIAPALTACAAADAISRRILLIPAGLAAAVVTAAMPTPAGLADGAYVALGAAVFAVALAAVAAGLARRGAGS